jgi:outer membrane protein assembly factor BamB
MFFFWFIHLTIASEWSGWGGNIYNNRWASQNVDVITSNFGSICSRCSVSYPVGISATPVLSQQGSLAYFPTWNGSLVAFDYNSCEVVWQVNVTHVISSFAPITDLQVNQSIPLCSRTSPQVDGDVLYFGTLAHALMVAVNRHTGAILAVIQTSPHPMALVTMSPTFYDGRLFVGVSSNEEEAAELSNYVCCSFVGTMLALQFRNGHFNVLWNTTMIPAFRVKEGWSGAAVWGSQPSIDTARSQVFIATGNGYTVPEAIISCQNATASGSKEIQVSDPCLPKDIWQEAVLAIDIDLGVPNWVHQLPPLDAFTFACGIPGFTPKENPASCPQLPGTDADFGMAPTFVPGSKYTPQSQDTIIIGQKNGNLYAMSAQTGHVFWSVATSPGGAGGGLSWGVAVDDKRVYFSAINSAEVTWQLQPSNQTAIKSAHGAASLLNGSLIWEVDAEGIARSMPTIVGDLVLVGRTGTDPNSDGSYDETLGSFVVLNKATGTLLVDRELDANFHGGIAVKGRHIMFGTGYNTFTGNGTFHVMQVLQKGEPCQFE